jgi:hypothetical protein
VRLAQAYANEEDLEVWESSLTLKDTTRQQILSLGISENIINELHIKSDLNEHIIFPVLMYNKLIDIRCYVPHGNHKISSRTGAIAGLILPYDTWVSSDKNRVTIICAGEKDMAVARSQGFNAITITGGENALPVCTSAFKDRKVVICYDNDGAGKSGAIRLANFLKPIAKSVKNCTNFHSVCVNDKEDITDFFTKYNKTREDLIAFFNATPEHEVDEQVINALYPLVDLHEATQAKYVGKIVRSNIQIVAVSEASFIAPAAILAEKTRMSEAADDRMYKGEIKEWVLSNDTAQDLLHMIDNNFKESDLEKNYKNILNILQKEKYVRIRQTSKTTVFKCYVTDMFETINTDVIPMEYTAYAIGTKLESGKKYLATYKLVPHPYKGQQLIMLITSASQASDSVSKFTVGDKEKENLAVIKNLPGTVAEKVDLMVNKFKGILGYDGNNLLIKAMDFAFHTALYFNLGQFRNERAYLDTLIVGESRMGKSSTADAMRETYGLGTFTSLAGNAATIPGLIGGSNKLNGSFQTRAGIIPQNHRGLIIFEELGKSNANVIAELTDIRSSNEVRIARVSGTITLPATVRMITLTNVKTTDNMIKPIASYPHGISILTELIGTAEDIARYDLSVILGDRGPQTIDPFWQPAEPFPIDVYRTRIRWIWSRTPEQIEIAEDVGHYIIQKSNELNQTYNCHIKIFGTEAWKKIARLAIAIAGYVVSTNDDYTHIIVTKEHIDYAVQFLISVYDNSTFKLKEYATHERMYSTIDAAGIALLQDIYIKKAVMLLHLEQTDRTTKNTIQAATGLTNEEYNGLMNRLVNGLFVTFSKYDIIHDCSLGILEPGGLHVVN